MIFQILLFVWEFMMDIASISGMGSDEKDLEIADCGAETGARAANPTLAEGATGNANNAIKEAGKGWKSCAGRKCEIVQTSNCDWLAPSAGPASVLPGPVVVAGPGFLNPSPVPIRNQSISVEQTCMIPNQNITLLNAAQ